MQHLRKASVAAGKQQLVVGKNGVWNARPGLLDGELALGLGQLHYPRWRPLHLEIVEAVQRVKNSGMLMGHVSLSSHEGCQLF